MREPYWRDLNYAKVIARNVEGAQILNASEAPLILLHPVDNTVGHIASLPGFLSCTNLNELKRQVTSLSDYLEVYNIATAFLQYRGGDTASEIENALRHASQDTILKLEKRTRVSIDLSASAEDMLQQCRRDTRSRVRQAIKKNCTYRIEYNKEFQIFYDEIAQQNSFSKSYCYDAQDLFEICNAKGVYSVSVYNEDNDYVGGAVIGLVNENEADYILSAYDPAHKNAGRAVLWNSLLMAKELGCKSINLGGGVSEEDFLFDFKMSFGGTAIPFYTLKLVFDEPQYRYAYGITNKELTLEGRFPI